MEQKRTLSTGINDSATNTESTQTLEEEGPAGFCTECHKGCGAEWQDQGIGPYEFWGQRGVDHNWQYVSDCCEAPVVDSHANPIDLPSEYEDDPT